MRTTTLITATRRRKRRQSGHEILEFALVAILFIPLLMGSFVTGMNLIRSIQANHVARDLANMYILGADFSSYPLQQLADRLAGGLDLQIGSSFSGNTNSNTGNGGRGMVWVSKIMWVGATTDPNCQAVGGANCTNHDSFVFTERIRFGNGGSLASERPSSLGDPSATMSVYGVVQNPITTAGAKLPGSGQTDMQALWQVSGGGRTPLVDGQSVYVVETYFKSPDLSLGSFPGQGVYARYFF
jgi:hypothetical protein